MEEYDQEAIDQQPDREGSISAADYMAVFNQHGGLDGWMQSSTVMRSPGMLPWLLGASVVRRNDHVDTA
ncbi:predicted protein [Lichtheimia corymbifera JMRC:FSU:9682]|uniref:Uncharacterized protein n=1 Tax=Lichtheimia corymbifera JMRC:FSU:9682 TaxID=1263082 RepID=A0A068S119_9FUNG|nr:predicted protein [Lichtheimia corymbifera JMRC:FSU:9682]